jgi:DNA-binding Lrp family transcriptional regulator
MIVIMQLRKVRIFMDMPRLSKGAISAGVKKLKDAPFLKRFGSRTDRGKLDKKATQAAREAGAEERREARGMKHGGMVSSASKRADGCAKRGKTKCKMV